jgi:hypothetical protein
MLSDAMGAAVPINLSAARLARRLPPELPTPNLRSNMHDLIK